MKQLDLKGLSQKSTPVPIFKFLFLMKSVIMEETLHT